MKVNYRKLLAFGAMLAVGAMLTTSAIAQDKTEDLYKTKCASCHGADGKAETAIGKKMAVKSFSDPEIAKNTDQTWIDITKKGKGKMPGYEGKLTDDQINDLVKYIRTLSKK